MFPVMFIRNTQYNETTMVIQAFDNENVALDAVDLWQRQSSPVNKHLPSYQAVILWKDASEA